MNILTEYEIEHGPFLKGQVERAKLLKYTVKKDYETSRTIAFTVGKDEKHSVMYNKTKHEWSCDCRWFSMKSTYCSHILAVHLYLQR